MDRSLFIGMSGAKQNMLSQQAHANNLANVNTTGFKRDFAQARSMPVYGEGNPTRAYAMTERPGTDTKQGSLISTGRDLDVAINGDGWLAVQADNGQEAYSRAGSLSVDVNGILRSSSGTPVLGNGGPVAVPPFDKMTIGSDGTISVIPAGGPPDQLVDIDRLKLVNPPKNTMFKGPDGLMRIDGQGAAPADASVQVETGFLESSNVNAVEEMIANMDLARQYEMQIKVMQTAKSNSEATARLLQNL